MHKVSDCQPADQWLSGFVPLIQFFCTHNTFLSYTPKLNCPPVVRGQFILRYSVCFCFYYYFLLLIDRSLLIESIVFNSCEAIAEAFVGLLMVFFISFMQFKLNCMRDVIFDFVERVFFGLFSD